MPKRFKTDHDAITALIVSFDDFKEQDKQDKLLIRNDIKQLGDGVIHRMDSAERALVAMNVEKEDLRKTAIDMDHRITRVETTVYGPNRDGKGGGAEQIVNLGNAIADGKTSFESTRKWVYVLISGAILVTFSIMGYFIFQLNINEQEHKVFQADLVQIKTSIQK